RCPPTAPPCPGAFQEGMATPKGNTDMKRISAFSLALLLAAGGSAFAASSQDDSGTSHSGSAAVHRLGADLRGALHKIGSATRNAWHRADGAIHRAGHRDTGNS